MESKTYVRVLRDLKFKRPVLIEGLPGIGLVGKIAAEHLARELGAKRIAEIYSPHFPHQVIMRKNGTIRMLRNVVYGWKQGSKEIVIVLGDVQAVTSEGQFEVTTAMLDYFKSIGVKRIYTLGGYGCGKHLDKPRVLGAATHKRLVDELSKKGVIFGESRGTIIGAAGMLLGLGKLRGMEGVCLMGETHGAYVDANSAKSLLKKVCELLGVKISLDELEKRVKIDKIAEKQMRKMKETDSRTHGTPSYIR
ncbi:MAG: proteasome assembly chaperone family protein [Candidatus Micrarchaeota archaeon]|nr:proteasome assembly chaperone family protein [Candidatus Micrarchaeota archaeon]